MEVYVLDSLQRPITIIDKYQSLIWTERFAGWGDFELTVVSTLANRSLFVAEVRLAIKESQRVMVVETVEDTTDNEQRKILKLSGRSVEKVLDDRLARGSLTDLTATPTWILTGTPVEVAEQIFHDVCVTGVLDDGDVIANVIEGDDIYPVDTNDEPTDDITYEIDMMSVYKAIKDLCVVYGMGFRLGRNFNAGPNLYWDIYVGSDRTTGQTTLPSVVFSPELDNLQNTTRMESSALYKNVAYVFSKEGFEIVYGLNVDPDVEGFERRVIFVKVDDIEDGDPDASSKMTQKGAEALGKARNLIVFDGELSPTSQYVYGTDYNLGDLVELRNDSGTSSVMRVTEQIFVSDKEGSRAYPTLTLFEVVTSGSWSGITPPEIVWYDYDLEEWDDLP
jgi:hypothetical protein